MRIDYLEDVPEFVSLLAPAMADHWRNIIPGESYDRRYEKLISHKNRDQLPLAWVAHENGVPLGTSALRVCDLEGREDLTPWLAGIFVMPGYRGRGVAAKLCEVAERKAWEWGVTSLYLHTPDQQGLYRKLGWRSLELADWNGVQTEIMIKDRGA
ncbi:GNAT family N-acetyltransferase [Vreelandella alkaliphila]|uniref:GNAT family N-acetyltransferase n=1 Tax=Vreelandella alkaliphila TaxID=272774 RepID=UPI003FD831CE